MPILLRWQTRLYYVLLGLFIALLVNSSMLWAWSRTASPPPLYYAMLLLHFCLGLGVLIPFGVYAFSHQRRARSLSPNRVAAVMGFGLALTALVCLAAGLYLFVLAASGGAVTRRLEWCLTLHRVAAWAIPLAYLGHMRSHLLRTRSIRGRRLSTAAMAIIVVALAFGQVKANDRDVHLLPVDPFAGRHSPFFPSAATTHNGGVLGVSLLLSSQQCAQCHADVYRQWNESAHHFSSFNNPWYKASIDYMRDIDGAQATQWCGGCHDAAMLLPGLMKMKEKMALPESHAGVACLVCHSIEAVPNTTGNGSYVLSPPPAYPWEGDGNPLLSAVSRFLIRVKPGPHRVAMLKPLHTESQFCSACHKVSLSEPVDNYRWFRGFDTWDEFQDSGVSGFSARSFYQPPHPMTCASCHMPLVPSHEFGSVNGMVHSHRFPGANTALPALKGYPEQVQMCRDLLQGAVTLDLFDMVGPGGIVAPLDRAVVDVVPGHSYRVDLVVRTRKVGHAFPSGTTDAADVWTALKVIDGSGKTVFWSGYVDPGEHIDPDAHFFRTVAIDGHAHRINKRNAWQRRSTVYSEAIPPGAARVVRYRVEVPPQARLPLTMEAHLYYRKFDDYFHHFSFDGHVEPGAVDKAYDDRTWRVDGPRSPRQPIVEMARAQVQVGAGAHNVPLAEPLWERYNDFGIGMLLASDARNAEWAWRQVTAINPGYADGYVNMARALLSEGADGEALPWLERASQVDADSYKAHYFRAVVLKNQGRYEDVVRELEPVAARFPDDREVQKMLGRSYLLLRDYGRSIEHYNRALEIDGEDAAAHQGLMLSYGAQGDEPMARAHEARFLRFRPHEQETGLNERYLLDHPDAHREAQPIHEHLTGTMSGSPTQALEPRL